MRAFFVFALAAALLGGAFAPARAGGTAADFELLIEDLAKSRPYEAFSQPQVLPDGFKSYLWKYAYPAVVLSNARVYVAYREYLAEAKSGPAEGKDPKPKKARTAKLGQAAAAPPGAVFDGAMAGGKPAVELPAAEPLPEPARTPKMHDRRGPRLLGLEFGAGQDQIQKDNEPYLRKGVEQALDWDLRARVALDGLGGSARYRHPEGFRSLTVGFLKFFDWPESIGLGQTRDSIYRGVGQTPDKPQGGFELGASGAINEYFGGNTTWDRRQSQKGDRYTSYDSVALGMGWSPLGDNTGKPWNYTLLGSIAKQSAHVSLPGQSEDRAGLGYSLGVAYQHALQDVPIPVLQPHPCKDCDFFFDRLKLSMNVSRSVISSFSVQAAAEVSFYVYKRLGLNFGVQGTFRPHPDPWIKEEDRLGANVIVGVDLRY